MKIQDAARKHPPFNEPDGKAEWMIRSGEFVKFEEPSFAPPKPAPVLKWQVREGYRAGDYQHPPILFFSCPACGTKGQTESQSGTAHKTAKVFHCGLKGVVCPEDVAAEYVKQFAAWQARSKNKKLRDPELGIGVPASATLPITPAQRAAGIKTHQELVQEAVGHAYGK